MTIEELYAAARAAELARSDHNSRHLDDLRRLDRALPAPPAPPYPALQPTARPRRSES